MKPVATVILNRNLPKVTDELVEHIKRTDGDVTDIYVVDSGSDASLKSAYTSWEANWPESKRVGLRYPRGMNYGLSQLYLEGKFSQYDAFFLLSNDAEFDDEASVTKLFRILEEHPRVGILSPCGKTWGERKLLSDLSTKYFWFIHNNAYFLRRQFIESVMTVCEEGFMNFLFDGNNFRGYGLEHELIAKAYANDWAAAITSDVLTTENESYLLSRADLIKTDGYHENFELYIREGKDWMRGKYGFNSHWTMQQYVKGFYDAFFTFHPELEKFKI